MCLRFSRDSELESTREALEEYQASSKELEQELERDIEAREKREAQLNTMLEVAQAEVQDWRTKFQTSLKEHSKTLTHVTKELDAVRKSEEAYRTKLRDMELDNDDLEKSERLVQILILGFGDRVTQHSNCLGTQRHGKHPVGPRDTLWQGY